MKADAIIITSKDKVGTASQIGWKALLSTIPSVTFQKAYKAHQALRLLGSTDPFTESQIGEALGMP